MYCEGRRVKGRIGNATGSFCVKTESLFQSPHCFKPAPVLISVNIVCFRRRKRFNSLLPRYLSPALVLKWLNS